MVSVITTSTVSASNGQAVVSSVNIENHLDGYKPIGILGVNVSKSIPICDNYISNGYLYVQFVHWYPSTYDVYATVNVLFEKE